MGTHVTEGLVWNEPHTTFLVVEMDLINKEPVDKSLGLEVSNELLHCRAGEHLWAHDTKPYSRSCLKVFNKVLFGVASFAYSVLIDREGK